MIAMYDPGAAELLRRRIEVLERAGQEAIASRLRDELVELEQSGVSGEPREPDEPDEDDTVIDDGEVAAKLAPLAVFPRRVATVLNRYRVVTVEDLAQWDRARLSKLPGFGPRDICQVADVLTQLGLPRLLASGDVPDELPPLDPGALDRLDGRTPEDVDEYLRKLASGVPDREVSAEMGAPESWYGHAHQRAQSLKHRHYPRYCEFLLAQFRAEFKHADWWSDVSLSRADFDRPRAPKTLGDRAAWMLNIEVCVSEAEALKRLPEAVKTAQGWCWRSVLLAFEVTGETDVQAIQSKVRKLGGKYRVTDANGIPLKTPAGKPLDKGGYATPGEALARVKLIGSQQPPTRKQQRAGRSAEIARSRKERGGAVHAPKKLPDDPNKKQFVDLEQKNETD